MEDERFYTVEQLAERWQVTAETVRRFIRRGELMAMSLGKKGGYRIRASEVDRFEKAREKTIEQ